MAPGMVGAQTAKNAPKRIRGTRTKKNDHLIINWRHGIWRRWTTSVVGPMPRIHTMGPRWRYCNRGRLRPRRRPAGPLHTHPIVKAVQGECKICGGHHAQLQDFVLRSEQSRPLAVRPWRPLAVRPRRTAMAQGLVGHGVVDEACAQGSLPALSTGAKSAPHASMGPCGLYIPQAAAGMAGGRWQRWGRGG